LTFRFIADHRDEFPVARMCDALEVSASGYYAWVDRDASPTAVARTTLAETIAAVHAAVRGRYGSPRTTAELNARGHPCSENTVAKVMREHGIRAKAPRRRVRTTDSNHRLPAADNRLARAFDPAEPNRAWAADITHIPTGEVWVYLAVVEGLFSRMIVGWSMADHLESRLVVDALDMAIAAAGRMPH
jgi:transposase InsO family protein